MMNFEYFQGPTTKMGALCKEDRTCSICGCIGKCFNLEFAIIKSEQASEAGCGCMDCLITGKFEFWHDTEIGMLDETGLTKVYNHNQIPPENFPASALVALRRTPQFNTWQQELWLTHCNDFMVYQGTWEPADFYQNAPSGDGRKLFHQMTDTKSSLLWDASLPRGQTVLEHWHATYYVFKCKHCGKLRGNWDCD
jgi:hypothetical protein